MAEPLQTQSAPSSRDGRVRWWDLLIAFGGGNVLGIVVTLAAGAIALVVMMHHGVIIRTQQDLTNVIRAAQANFWANHIALVVSDLGVLGGIWFAAWLRFTRPVGHFFTPARPRTIVLAALSGVGLSVALNGGNELLERAGWVTFRDLPNELALVPHGLAQFAATIAVVALFAPFVEEYFFRGLFFTWAKRWGVTFATLLTAVFFSFAHGHWYVHWGVQGLLYSFELFVAGIVLALWVVRTGSLRTSFATHAAYNATAIVFSAFLT